MIRACALSASIVWPAAAGAAAAAAAERRVGDRSADLRAGERLHCDPDLRENKRALVGDHRNGQTERKATPGAKNVLLPRPACDDTAVLTTWDSERGVWCISACHFGLTASFSSPATPPVVSRFCLRGGLMFRSSAKRAVASAESQS
ncbi:hypothetical protein FQN60_014614 [Etheostoma spectabile]|uniref:Secreted protein n=1 Tax=Etheostoma spectabile TaxID=54343 RepID=A0A5J5DBU6_9PERO|nr:hypothetical protein FQN60_014607 [Etheostoma spectabile]KAA8590680.1 hypothetical protein FQN60_014614 [Etheostoma spectabile]